MSSPATAVASPASLPRRSFIYRDLMRAGALFRPVGDGTIAVHYGDAIAEAQSARSLGLADLSPLPRTGFKGWGTADWLNAQNVALGETSNRAYPCGGNSLAARLSPGEVLILGSLDGNNDTLWQDLETAWNEEAATCWPVPRRNSSFWFLVTGNHAPSMFAKICSVDLRPNSLANHTIAQTSIARLNGIVVRDDIGNTLAYHVLGDSASATYMWSCLLDAMQEFDGAIFGLDALQLVKDRD